MARRQIIKGARQRQSDLGGEHPFGDAGQLVLACLFFAVWGGDTFTLEYTTWLNRHVPLAIRVPVGVVLLANVTPVAGWIPVTCFYTSFILVIVSGFSYIYQVSRFVDEARAARELEEAAAEDGE